MLRQQFDRSLNQLHQDLLTMGQAVLQQLQKLHQSLPYKNLVNYRQLIDQDSLINAQEVALEEEALQLIALQQPVSQDLRRVITALKASSDIERMGDHLRAIATSLIALSSSDVFREMAEQIKAILELISPFLEAVFAAYEDIDSDKAIELSLADKEIDIACQEAKEQILTYLKTDPQAGKDYLAIILHLERLGDYARNVCEWIVYLKLGKLVTL